MLVELRIRNVAVIDTVSLPLAAGLNVLTGETGAGKSLIVGALGMLLGDRAAGDRVRAGTERASVEGVFDVAGRETLHAWLDAHGLEADEGLLVLKREVQAAGRSRAWINGAPVSAGLLADVGAQLVSVHGQHESRQLVDTSHQRDLLDAFADAMALRTRVRDAHAALAGCVADEREMLQRSADARRRADWLRHVVQEVDDARLTPGEDESLDAEIRRLSHAEELRALATQAAQAIAGDERAALARLAHARRALAALVRIDEAATVHETTLESARLTLDELARELEHYADAIDIDPSALRKLESRRELLLGLMRRHGPTLAEVIATGHAAHAELALVDGSEAELAALRAARDAAEAALRDAASALTSARRAAASRLGDAVSALLPELGMAHGRVEVRLMPLDAIGADGAESVLFEAMLNAGAERRPLGKLASGGELSRVMLALSTVLARLQAVPTLVFDEIDAGIGGAVAWQVGALMRRVAAHHQVLAISHLAQIAAVAHRHIVVAKGAVGAVTTADTQVVVDEARVVEVARMLGGDADRDVSRAHARELLERGVQLDDAVAPTPPKRTQRRGKPV
ncbi:MAG: DNA repair protein RecN [Gemmatimonadetes bacterium]|nr:DNA repair protein RecN [Gemmatimonadota bacterium]